MKRSGECILTFWVVVFVAWVLGLVKVILTGDMCGGSEFAMLCIRLLIFGLLLTGTVMLFEVVGVTLGTSFSKTGEEPEELVRRRLRGFSSSSEQLTPERERLHDKNKICAVISQRMKPTVAFTGRALMAAIWRVITN